MPAIFINLLPS